jgi:SAM-dependent MidA family methyltransferase
MPSWIAEIARAEGGKISFERFMQLALFEPRHGYYTRHVSAVGPRGDFSTALTVGDALVRSIANWVHFEARHLALTKLNIIELGGGDGCLAQGILQTFRPWEGVRYQIVEISDSLRKFQKRTLQGRKIRWQHTIEAALDAAEGRAILIANEFVDAFPCKRFERGINGWREIILNLEENLWREQLENIRQKVESSAFSIGCAPGQRIETHGSYSQWLAAMSSHLVRGALLTIDYGGWPAEIYSRRPHGTIRAFFRHQRFEGMAIYLRAGRQDLTADVNFLDLHNWGEAVGLRAVDFTNQKEFIRRWDRAGRTGSSAADEFVSDPNGMGNVMKVLHQRKGD